MTKESRNSLLIVGGVVLVVVVVMSMRSSATTIKGGTTLSGGAGWLAGAGSLATGLGKGISSVLGSISGSGNPPSDGDYEPAIAHGDDLKLGGE